MTFFAYFLSGLSLLLGVAFLLQAKPPPSGFILMLVKLIASALSPVWLLIGLAGAVLGWYAHSPWAIPIGLAGAGMMGLYIWRCARGHDGFERAFGKDWQDRIPPEQSRRMLRRRWGGWVNLKARPAPIWERDIPFWTVPEKDRAVLCDLWRPADGKTSGMAIIYFHGSGWFVGDKDMMTRPFFNHLVAQGHTVMDVAYRLCPEVDIFGMIEDVWRAIDWMKANAGRYGVDPNRIVLSGGSAGCHLSLLAAYTPGHPELTPKDLLDHDLTVRGVVSYYGPIDMVAEHKLYMWKDYYSEVDPVPIGTRLDLDISSNPYVGRLDMLLGGHPGEVPERYELASPISHVNAHCPPTLLLNGEKDLLVPVATTRALHEKLAAAGVPSVCVTFPWTDHAFDLVLPSINPAAQSAMYDVDRFLALLNQG